MYVRKEENQRISCIFRKSVLCIRVQSSLQLQAIYLNCISLKWQQNSSSLSLFTFGQIAYYVLRRDKPEEWKCQPYQWLPRDLEIHEMVVGWFSLSIGSLISSALACWVMNGGWSTLYFDPAEHGYVWLVLQIPVIFIWQVIKYSWLPSLMVMTSSTISTIGLLFHPALRLHF